MNPEDIKAVFGMKPEGESACRTVAERGQPVQQTLPHPARPPQLRRTADSERGVYLPL